MGTNGHMSDQTVAQPGPKPDYDRLFAANAPIIFNCREAASIVNLSNKTLQQMARDKKIEALRPGGPRGNYRFTKQAILKFLGLDEKGRKRS